MTDAVILPAWEHRGIEYWWRRHSVGVYDSEGHHVITLSDYRGERRICFPPACLEQARFNRAKAVTKRVVLYGGTLYDHFGHLLMDSARAYRLLREFRNSKLPIWFHDCTPHNGSVLALEMVQQWLGCLGIAGRARIVRHPLLAGQLISGPALYSDRRFVSRDLREVCQQSLQSSLRLHLEGERPPRRRLAYLSRHRLSGGSTRFAGEAALVEALADWAHVDVICPEELGFEDKIALYHRYEVIAGFPQSCMNLKLFSPVGNPARQVMFIAGPCSLSSSWVNIEHATGFGDLVVDCGCGDPGADAETQASLPGLASPEEADQEPERFQRTNRFDRGRALAALAALAG